MRVLLIVSSILFLSAAAEPTCWKIGRVKYSGGGDWYSDPSSLPNLIGRINKDLGVGVCAKEGTVEFLDPELYQYPMLYLTGHGNITFSESERQALRDYLFNGGFLLADDNFGLDSSFRREIKRAFPNTGLFELAKNHSVFSSRYSFSKGLPKIHEHGGKRAQLFGLELNGRIALLYSYESDLGDGWEDPKVHQVPPATREQALRMGVNIIAWFMQGQSIK